MLNLLLTNDDGIDARGLEVLRQAARPFGHLLVVAPDRQYSGCGHQSTYDRPINVHQRDRDHFAVEGSPADCVRVALTHLGQSIDWVLSGINEGANLGLDIYLSGTVAAAREAAWLGVPSIALSQYHRGPVCDQLWEQSFSTVTDILHQLLQDKPEPGRFWNVNLPDGRMHQSNGKLQLVNCPLDPHPLPIEYHRDENRYHFKGDYHGRRRMSGHDVDVCFEGNIAVTLI